MKIRNACLLFTVLALSLSNGQMPTTEFTASKELKIFGHASNYYEIQSSTDLVHWFNQSTEQGEYLQIQTVPYSKVLYDALVPNKFFKVRPVSSADNFSWLNTCAEYDNVRYFIRGDNITKYFIEATQPTYVAWDYYLDDDADFSNCNGAHAYASWPFYQFDEKIYNGGAQNSVCVKNKDATFWRPGMTVFVNGGNIRTNIQQLYLLKQIPGVSSWPTYFVLYCDGYMRLIPFPPAGQSVMSFGSSVIVGPTDLIASIDEQDARPACDIESVDYQTATASMLVKYRSGGSSVILIKDVTRAHSLVQVDVNYPTDKPVCTLMSNYVSTQKCDTSTVIWKDFSGAVHTDPIMSFSSSVGKEWFFTRPEASITRNSAGDIRITIP